MLKITRYTGNRKEIDSLIVRSQLSYKEVNETVKAILEEVRTRGDKALLNFTERFDQVKLTSIAVSAHEIEAAYQDIDPDLRQTLGLAHHNIKEFHQCQLRQNFFTHKKDGVVLGQLFNPIERVGIYVPGGTAAYPSTVLMNAVPAKLAGVSELILVSPPDKQGKLPKAVLAAARIAGVDKVFSIGGAQAVAALTYGTESVPKVYKIVGPGNIYVAEAKRQVFGEVGIDMFAGPSEILIVADETANPVYLAADMLSQAEHDRMASSVLVTTDMEQAVAVQVELEKQLLTLSRQDIARTSIADNGRIVVVDNLEQAVDISNAIAPEHLELCVADPFALLSKIKNAGSIFMGHYSPEPLGDYFAGPNHTLPTSGTATFSSPLSVDDFIKKSSVIYYTKPALKQISTDVVRFARSEGLDAHAAAVEKRFAAE